MEKEEIEIKESSGNVFEDLGFPDAQEALAKSKLAIAIYLIIKARKLTQQQAAEIMGTDQPHVSDIIRGKLSGFTIDRLLKFLLALGRDIEITIKEHKAKKQPPSIYVMEEPMAVGYDK
jgi:predicted XRE-type DNA-binding protein